MLSIKFFGFYYSTINYESVQRNHSSIQFRDIFYLSEYTKLSPKFVNRNHSIITQRERRCLVNGGNNSLVNVTRIEQEMREDTVLVSAMAHNNEIGVAPLIREIDKLRQEC